MRKNIKNRANTYDKILQAAYDVFLFYGFHGTTIQEIAISANVNKAAVHYYFRSKENLYSKIIEYVFNFTIYSDFTDKTTSENNKKVIWFLTTELYNNSDLLKKTLKSLYPNEIEKRLFYINRWLQYVPLYEYS
ncbi:MAG: hypothetical protein A2309_11150 [Bacteroidetes bacterium RIFOXYB2_FULL_35_7]|nr:MAG: hypothetical protein A2X01_20675 [Bacteroidetes bacterium GWF2_35_48]OFY97083.1 MAG: hypothetical protein A2309_11150 [Bacteroidetes bacterium RIFOXYB2_FULL_35_7]HBX51779.1 hypothetical protein [Bacteroidales bacterium]